jgi:hypothetical protein
MDLMSRHDLARLDRRLDLFLDTPETDPELLAQGLHPPLPVSGEVLVWGFALLRQAARLGVAELAVRRLPSLSRADLLALALRLEGRPGGLSWREKENLLRFAEGTGGRADPIDLDTLSPLIEGHPDSQLRGRIKRFASLPASLGEEVSAGRLDLKTAELAAALPGEAAALVAGSPLSFSERRRFLTMLLELSRRERTAAEALSTLARRLLEDPHPVEALAGLRYPTLAGLSSRFATLAERLWKGSGVRIEPPPHFEGDGFSVSFRFDSADSLDRELRALRRVGEQANELFALLR